MLKESLKGSLPLSFPSNDFDDETVLSCIRFSTDCSMSVLLQTQLAEKQLDPFTEICVI